MTNLQPIGDERRSPQKRTIRKASAQAAADSKDWTIKRLAPETIEITREAARLSGMKINAWVGKALQEAAATRDAPLAGDSAYDRDNARELEKSILEEIAQLRAQNADLVETVNSISAILLKMYTSTSRA